MTISIKNIKKGARVRLRGTGWLATVTDNTVNAHTRVCDVEGMYREIGSVYTTDIAAVLVGDVWHDIEFTPGQLKQKAQRAAMGF